MFAVDIDDVGDRLRAHGAELVGELAPCEDKYRLCYVRGPEGVIIVLALVSKFDHSPRRKLPAGEGVLWVGFRLAAEHGFTDTESSKQLERFVDLVHRAHIGSWDGQSSGAGQVDVSFEVENIQVAAQAVRRLIAREFPERDFWVSDTYETTFDR